MLVGLLRQATLIGKNNLGKGKILVLKICVNYTNNVSSITLRDNRKKGECMKKKKKITNKLVKRKILSTLKKQGGINTKELSKHFEVIGF